MYYVILFMSVFPFTRGAKHSREDGTVRLQQQIYQATAIFHILKKNEPYNPQLYRQSDVSPVDPVAHAVRMLEKRGFIVSQATGK